MREINEEYSISPKFFIAKYPIPPKKNKVKYPIPPKKNKVKYPIPPKFCMSWSYHPPPL